jgi:protease PrsW
MYGSAVGFGFAAAENQLYIMKGFTEYGLQGLIGVAGVRILLIPFLHAALASLTGLGLAYTRMNGKIWTSIVGFAAAVFFHFMHNLFAALGSVLALLWILVDWAGFFAMMILIIFLVFREKTIITNQLAEEVQLGTISAEEYSKVCQVLHISRLKDRCGRLAFMKYSRKAGEEYIEEIAALRSSIKSLKV